MTDQRRDNLGKLNTTLLSICTAGIIWIGKTVVDLKSDMSEVKANNVALSAEVGRQQTIQNEMQISVVDLQKEVYNLKYIVNLKK